MSVLKPVKLIGFNQFWITESSLTTCNSPRQCTKYKQDRL